MSAETIGEPTTRQEAPIITEPLVEDKSIMLHSYVDGEVVGALTESLLDKKEDFDRVDRAGKRVIVAILGEAAPSTQQKRLTEALRSSDRSTGVVLINVDRDIQDTEHRVRRSIDPRLLADRVRIVHLERPDRVADVADQVPGYINLFTKHDSD